MVKFIINKLSNPTLIIYKCLFYFSFYISFLILFLTFDIALSPDFDKYYNYFLFYDGQIEKTGLEQGNLYFFLCYLVSSIINLLFSAYSTNEIVNLSIHLTNTSLYLFGLLGFKNYLLKKGLTKSNVYLSFLLMVFLPSGIEMRLTLKPELLAFSLLGWTLYFLTNYFITENNKNLYLFVIFLSFLITSKASLAFMTVIFLLIEIWINYKKLFSKKYLKYYLITIFLCSVLLVENLNLNGEFITQVNHNENYDNRAKAEFFTTLNKEDLTPNPNRYFHNDSFISITLFDTFSDFFQIYWNSEYTELNKGRKNFFKINRNFDEYRPPTIEYNKNEKFLTIYGNFDARYADSEYTNETRMRGAFKFSILFYVSLLIISLFKRKDMNAMLSPFLGILIVALSALGIFGNNFDPDVGDSVKTYYYSFFIAFSFLLLINRIFEFNIGKKTISFLILIFFIFLLGFPHSYEIQVKDELAYKNSLLPTCEVNSTILKNILGVEQENRCDPENFIYRANNKIQKMPPIFKITQINFNFHIKRIPIFQMFFVFIALFISSQEFLIKDKRGVL